MSEATPMMGENTPRFERFDPRRLMENASPRQKAVVGIGVVAIALAVVFWALYAKSGTTVSMDKQVLEKITTQKAELLNRIDLLTEQQAEFQFLCFKDPSSYGHFSNLQKAGKDLAQAYKELASLTGPNAQQVEVLSRIDLLAEQQAEFQFRYFKDPNSYNLSNLQKVGKDLAKAYKDLATSSGSSIDKTELFTRIDRLVERQAEFQLSCHRHYYSYGHFSNLQKVGRDLSQAYKELAVLQVEALTVAKSKSVALLGLAITATVAAPVMIGLGARSMQASRQEAEAAQAAGARESGHDIEVT